MSFNENDAKCKKNKISGEHIDINACCSFFNLFHFITLILTKSQYWQYWLAIIALILVAIALLISKFLNDYAILLYYNEKFKIKDGLKKHY